MFNQHILHPGPFSIFHPAKMSCSWIRCSRTGIQRQWCTHVTIRGSYLFTAMASVKCARMGMRSRICIIYEYFLIAAAGVRSGGSLTMTMSHAWQRGTHTCLWYREQWTMNTRYFLRWDEVPLSLGGRATSLNMFALPIDDYFLISVQNISASQ